MTCSTSNYLAKRNVNNSGKSHSAMLERQREANERALAERRRRDREASETKQHIRQMIDEALAPNVLGMFRRDLNLRPTEKRILLILMHHSGRLVSNEQINTLLYADRPEAPDEMGLKVHISNIRKKLPEGVSIETIWRLGYILHGTHSAFFEDISE